MNVIERIEKGVSKLTITKLSSDIPAYIRSREQEIELLELAKLGQQMQWVSVTERLPEHKQVVDIFLNGCRHIDVEFFIHNNEKFFYLSGAVVYYNYVTHWMPLPPNPKGAE